MEELLKIRDKREVGDPIIKVIGVGGGGGNAVNHMYNESINEVTFLLCNTDRQHLKKCSVPTTICIGETVTSGLGAGDRPEKAKEAALESEEQIRQALSDETRMVFITAGMGGGTGTGAAPVIARIAKEMGILTVGIVTIPFLFEGPKKIIKALHGVEEMAANVDAILVIKNELLRKVYPDFKISEAFQLADATLATAARSISELVTDEGIVNVDFADVHTTLSNGGAAIISRGYGRGENSVRDAIQNALESPLVNTSSFQKASRVLLYISFSKESEPDAQVFDHLNSFMSAFVSEYNFIWGYGLNESLGDQVRVTILASGFDEQSVIADEDQLKLIKEYYGEVMENDNTFRNEVSVIFSDDELDDDIFISLISDTPTLKRTTSTVERYRVGRNKPKEEAAPAPQEVAPKMTAQERTAPPMPQAPVGELDEELIMFGNK